LRSWFACGGLGTRAEEINEKEVMAIVESLRALQLAVA
jgi:hypothetical protein